MTGLSTDPPGGPSTDGEPIRVMVVEDYRDLRDMLAVFLSGWGYSVKACGSGFEALAEAPQFQPDIVLMDLGLPTIDGYHVAEHLRRHPKKPVLIALTGYGQAADVEHCRAAGFDLHLLKPVPPDALRHVLQGCLVGRETQSRLSTRLPLIGFESPDRSTAGPDSVP